MRKAHPGYEIAVTGLSAIAARNSANMIEKLNRGLTVEFALVALFIGLAFRSWVVMLACILPGIFPVVLAANLVANGIRNLWGFVIIFCGHFPGGVHMFTEEDVKNESRGAFYVRQLVGSCNIEGSALFHVLTGNLSHQIEHHLFPDVPTSRHAELAPRVRELATRYGLPYNTGSLTRQFGTTIFRIWKMALPPPAGTVKSW